MEILKFKFRTKIISNIFYVTQRDQVLRDHKGNLPLACLSHEPKRRDTLGCKLVFFLNSTTTITHNNA